MLRHEDGATGPVFKSFGTILPATSTDCHGETKAVAAYTEDAAWREQTDRVRATFINQFRGLTLLADSLDIGRTRAGGFDGIAIYDNYVRPASWRAHAEACTARDLVFSFNVNPGFDGVADRRTPPPSCYTAPKFEPSGAASRLGRTGRSRLRDPRLRQPHQRIVSHDHRAAERSGVDEHEERDSFSST